MAFQYKNILESALNKLPSRYSEQILAGTCDKIDKKVELSNQFFSYAVKAEVSEMLTKAGIELAPIAFNAHTHPACKMIENFLLYVYLPSLLSNIRSVAFFSLRESKVKNFIEMFQVFHYGEIKSMGMYNCLIDSKDVYRYGFNSFNSLESRLQGLKNDCLAANKFPKVLLCHDEMHFWSKDDIVNFFETIPEISKVVGTVVFPTEILVGETQSKEPRLYGFEIDGDNLFFFPEGEASEGYHQSISRSRFFFETSFIHIKKGRSIKISRLKSMFAHHVFSLEVVSYEPVPDKIFLNLPSALLTHELQMISDNFVNTVIERSTLQSICLYLSCLKTPNASSALAKLRQLEKRDLFPDEMSFVHVVAQELSKYGIGAEMNSGFFRKMTDCVLMILPSWLTGDFAGKRLFQLKIRALLNQLAKKRFEISRRVLDYSKDGFKIKIVVPKFSFGGGQTEASSSSWEPLEARFEQIFAPRSLQDCMFRLRRGWFVHPANFSHGPLLIEWPIESHSDSRVGDGPSNPPVAVQGGERELDEQKLNDVLNFGYMFNTDSYSSIPGVINSDYVDLAANIDLKARVFKRSNDCVFKAVAAFLGVDMYEVINKCINSDVTEDLFRKIEKDVGLTRAEISEVFAIHDICGICTDDFKNFYRLNSRGSKRAAFLIKDNHCELSNMRLFRDGIESSPDVRFDLELPSVKVVFKMEDAYALADSMKRGSTGVLKTIKPTEVSEVAEFVKNLRRKKMELNIKYSFGFAGSGKSKKVIDYINLKPTVRRMVVCPRNALRDDFKSKVEGTSTIVLTHEVALLKIDESFEEIVIDELSLLPAGYIALLVSCMFKRRMNYASSSNLQQSFDSKDFSKVKIVVLGDPVQARYFSELDCGLIRGEADIDLICRTAVNPVYLYQTYRMGEWFNSVLDIPTLKDGSKHKVRFHSDMSTVKVSEFCKVLVPDQNSKGDFQGPLEVMTYTEAQGLTFDKKSLIVVNTCTFKCSINSVMVALTRSRIGFDFLLCGINPKELDYLTKKGILNFVFKNEPIPTERIKNLIPGARFVKDEAIGSLEEKASNDPFILPFVNIANDVEVDHEDVGELVEAPEWFKTHIPQFDANPIINEIFEKMAEKEKREFRSLGSQSNQFYDLEKGLDKDEVYPMQFGAVFPRHEATDDETFWAGVKKRLNFSCATRERKKLDEVRKYGPYMADFFLRHMPNEFKVTNEDVYEGSLAFDKKRAEKSEKLWENHMERSDIDWNLDRVFLFMKSQLCTKEGKMFTEAKAGQTLACFQHIVLFKFGPMLRAIEKAFIRAVGESYYIHSGKNFFCLDEFVTRNSSLFDGRSIESDYESFDSCQDHVILAFELELLKRLGVCHNWIKDYETMKMNLTCRLGDMAIMRFTGEFCTFLFNTFANMLFTFLKYKVDPGRSRILFAGDDMASLGHLERRKCKGTMESRVLGLFSLKAVEEVKRFPSFCGWFLTPYGILKSPRLLWARICVMKQRGLLESCADNYLFEAIFAYRLSERLYEVLKEEDIEYHHLVTRFFIKNSKLLRGSSVTLLQEIGEGIGCLSLKSTLSYDLSRTQSLRSRQFSQKRFTAMHRFSTQGFFKPLKDLKLMLRSPLKDQIRWSSQTSSCWMIRKLGRYSQRKVNTTTYTLEQYLDASLQCFQIMKSSAELSLCMMGIVLIPSMRTLPALILILKEVLHILCSGPDTSLEPLIRTWPEDSGFALILNAQSTMLRLRYLLLTWVLCIVLQTLQDFSRMRMVQVGGLVRRYKVVMFCPTPMKLGHSLKNPRRLCHLRTLGLKLVTQREVCCCQEGALEGEIIELREREGWLSQLQRDLIGKKCLKMSLQETVLLIRRKQIALFLWKEMIDKESKLLHKDLLVIPEGSSFPRLEGDNEILFNSISYQYCKYFFGNIALFGSSPSVQFPDVNFWTPRIKMTIPVASSTGKEATGAQPRTNEVEVSWNINLYMDVPKVMTYLHSLRFNAVKNVTLRQACEPFAKEAYDFLKEMYPKGVTTNIYKKWPRAFKNAPHVCFDFAHGLNMSLLSTEEKGVIDNMTRRLFKTEGQKGVFEAQSESNIELEG